MSDTPISNQGNNLPPGISSIEATPSGDNINHIQPIEVTASAGQHGSPDSSGSSDFWSYVLSGMGGFLAGGLAGGPLGAVIGGLSSLGTLLYQNYQAEKQYKRAKQDALDAEQRANEEYDRRQSAAQEYNDAWDQRLLSKGYNPLSLLSKGQGATATNFSAPQTTSMPNAPLLSTPSLSRISSEMSLFEKLAQIRNIEADTRQKNASATGQENQNSVFFEQYDADMNLLKSQIRNSEALASINELEAQFKAATLDYDFQKAQYSAQSMFFQMQREGISVDHAKASLQQTLNAVAMQSIQAQLLDQQYEMNAVSLDQLVTTWSANKHLVDRHAQLAIDQLEQEVRAMEQTNNWRAFNNIVGGISGIASSVATVVNAFKPLPQFPSLMQTTTDQVHYNAKGNMTGSTITTKTNVYGSPS